MRAEFEAVSASAQRRRRRKQRDQLASATLVDDMLSSLPGRDDTDAAAIEAPTTADGHVRIGEKSASAPAGAKKRMRQSQREQAHFQAVLANPAFKASGLAAIRQHLHNTVVQKEGTALPNTQPGL